MDAPAFQATSDHSMLIISIVSKRVFKVEAEDILFRNKLCNSGNRIRQIQSSDISSRTDARTFYSSSGD